MAVKPNAGLIREIKRNLNRLSYEELEDTYVMVKLMSEGNVAINAAMSLLTTVKTEHDMLADDLRKTKASLTRKIADQEDELSEKEEMVKRFAKRSANLTEENNRLIATDLESRVATSGVIHSGR